MKWKGFCLCRSELLASGGTPCWAIAKDGRKLSSSYDCIDDAYGQLYYWCGLLRSRESRPDPWHVPSTLGRNVVICERGHCIPSPFDPDLRGFWTLAIASSKDNALLGLTEEQGHELSPWMACSLMTFFGQEKPLAPVAKGRERARRVYRE